MAFDLDQSQGVPSSATLFTIVPEQEAGLRPEVIIHDPESAAVRVTCPEARKCSHFCRGVELVQKQVGGAFTLGSEKKGTLACLKPELIQMMSVLDGIHAKKAVEAASTTHGYDLQWAGFALR